MLDAVCCLGEMKNVPSISGYLEIICKKGHDSAKCFYPPFKDDHLVVAEDAGDLVHLVSCIAGEDEAPCLVIANTTFILHLDTEHSWCLVQL